MTISLIKKLNDKYLNTENKKVGFYFFLSTIILSFIKLVTGILTLRWVPPAQLGLWNSILVLQSYLPILQLGVIAGIGRELPYLFGKGKSESIKELAATCSFVLLVVFVLILIVSSGFVIFGGYDSETNLTIMSVVFLTAVTLYTSYVTVAYRANQQFMLLSKINYFMAFIFLALIILPYKFGFLGYIERLIFSQIIMAAITSYFNPLKVFPKFSYNSFKKLVKTGLSLYIFGYFQEITTTFGRLALAQFSTLLVVGYYSPSISIYSGMAMVGLSIGQYLYPKMTYNYGKHGDSSNLWHWVWKSSLLIFLMLIPIVILSWLFLPFLFEKIFPKYMAGLFVAQIALISGAFESASIIINLLATLKAWRYWIFLTFFKVVTFAGFIFGFAKIMDPLLGVAIGQLLSQIIFFLTVLFVCYILTVLRPVKDSEVDT